ncbi:hypothetical protein AMTRI_Chr03g146030 [Amborella trichopoda]
MEKLCERIRAITWLLTVTMKGRQDNHERIPITNSLCKRPAHISKSPLQDNIERVPILLEKHTFQKRVNCFIQIRKKSVCDCFGRNETKDRAELGQFLYEVYRWMHRCSSEYRGRRGHGSLTTL